MSNIVERIEHEFGIPGLATILAQRLTPTDLQSLLLEVYHLRLIPMQPADVLSDYHNNRMVQPSRSSPLKMVKWEQIAFEHLPAEIQADGGVLDWTQEFLNNAKELLVASGIESERLCNEF